MALAYKLYPWFPELEGRWRRSVKSQKKKMWVQIGMCVQMIEVNLTFSEVEWRMFGGMEKG